jgi:hypothetical protein
MIEKVNECVGCACECVGCNCISYEFICDNCKAECDELYYYGGEQWCQECIMEQFKKVTLGD